MKVARKHEERDIALPTVGTTFLHWLGSWRGLLAWTGLGLAAFVAVVLSIQAEAKNLRGGRKTATGPSGNVAQ